MRRKRTSVHLRFLLFFSQVHSVFLRKRRRGRAGGRGQDGVVERRGASRARGVGEFDAVQLAEQPSRGKSAGRTPDRSRARRRNERRARRNARTTPRSRVACRASDPARTDRRARGAFDTAIIAQRPPGGRTRNRCCRRGEKRPRGRARAIGTRTPLCRSRAPCLRTVRSTFTDGRSRPSSCGARHGRAAVDAASGDDDDEARGSLSKTSPRHFPYVLPVLQFHTRRVYPSIRFFHPGRIRAGLCCDDWLSDRRRGRGAIRRSSMPLVGFRAGRGSSWLLGVPLRHEQRRPRVRGCASSRVRAVARVASLPPRVGASRVERVRVDHL